ncbi:bromodomain protein [Gigaspora margarita]|uniref:Bromodomain protein n=1 Tax=Gigaspora margarita TaxID=4874 RepID=A0A8H3X5Y7_GIGMA|nr:bromodomain protein [Gigaspora margarita]
MGEKNPSYDEFLSSKQSGIIHILKFANKPNNRLLIDKAWSPISLAPVNEEVLQVIVEFLLPKRYRIPQLWLVMNGQKKGDARTGEMMREFHTGELLELDNELEKANEQSLLGPPYAFWSKNDRKWVITSIKNILDDGIRQLHNILM